MATDSPPRKSTTDLGSVTGSEIKERNILKKFSYSVRDLYHRYEQHHYYISLSCIYTHDCNIQYMMNYPSTVYIKKINVKECLPSTPRSLFVGISPSSTPSGRGLKDFGMSRHFLTGAWDSTRFLNCVYTSGVLKALKENVQPLCLSDFNILLLN